MMRYNESEVRKTMDTIDRFKDLYRRANETEDPMAFAELLVGAPYRDDGQATQALLEEYGECGIEMVTPYVAGLIGALALENMGEEEFYRRLRIGVLGDALDEEQKECAFLLASINTQIPYDQVQVVSMDQEEFTRRSSALMPEVARIITLVNRPFKQKTEKASALLDVIESVDDMRDRSVLMSAMLDSLQPLMQNQPQ